MPYESIDALQNELSTTYFSRTKDPKKASGRALGTFVEIITYYLIKTWGFQDNLSIETKLPEYGYNSLTHNVEFTLHKIIDIEKNILIDNDTISINKIIKDNNISDNYNRFLKGSHKNVLYKNNEFKIIKNSTLIGSCDNNILLSYIDTSNDTYKYIVLDKNPFAMFECKRVGKEGDSKGPQTIEKAKQGAYVAKTVSSLQKIIRPDGKIMGIYFDNEQKYYIDEYNILLNKIINKDINNIKNFILTIGIVSNHGNWFTNSNKNKELEVLSNSYDWLLFLTDSGLTEFVKDIFDIDKCKESFKYSYSIDTITSKKNSNIFTKSCISYEADKSLTAYFKDNINKIETWFEILNKEDKSINDLYQQLKSLNS